jgi:hypothetical protein
MTEKEQLTKSIIDQLQLPLTLDEALTTWWVVPGRIGSLRLSFQGYMVFTAAYSQDYTLHVDNKKYPTVASIVNTLNQKLTTPYFLPAAGKPSNKIEVKIFDKKMAAVSKLYEDFDTFLKKKR